jgi:dimethylaniline monooxygenase (N-oxide forming)
LKTKLRKKLVIIGSGSSGLISLKYAIDHLTDWDIVALESSNSLQGCWGNPYQDFISTSTKYTTQFRAFPLYDTKTGDNDYSEFFRAGEYGEYLEKFAEEYSLRKKIQFQTTVEKVEFD